MNLQDLIKDLSLEIVTCEESMNNEVTGAYVSDLLSDVMANSNVGNIWITLQTHLNIIAVADMKGLAGIIIVGNRKPAEDVIEKARAEKVTVMTTPLPAFEAAGKLYQLLDR